MRKEASDIVTLLADLGHDGDATCYALYAYARRGEPVLDVCHDAIRALAEEKRLLTKRLQDALALLPPPPMLLSKEQAAGLDLKSLRS